VALAAFGRDHDVAGARQVQLAVVVGELDFAFDDVGDLVVRALEVTVLHVALPWAEAELLVDRHRRAELLPRRVGLFGVAHRFFPAHVLGLDHADPGVVQIAHRSF